MKPKPCLILLGGAPGTGKSTVAGLLYRQLPNSIWLDGDDLWRMHPFAVTDRTKRMVLRNIALMLDSILGEEFDYVIFSWVMHEPAIAESILRELKGREFRLVQVTLVCSEETLLNRIDSDTANRDPALCVDRIRRTRENYPDALDTDGLGPDQVVQKIRGLVDETCRTPDPGAAC